MLDFRALQDPYRPDPNELPGLRIRKKRNGGAQMMAGRAHADDPRPSALQALHRLRGGWLGACVGAMCPPAPNSSVAERCIHVAFLVLTTTEAVHSVRDDQWAVIRKRAPVESTPGLRGRILKKRRRAAQVGQLLGATSYSPRIVFLAGLMLRSLQKGTATHRVFEPSLGYAAGATLAAWFAKREWLSCMMLGWGFGGAYWRAFRVQPPPRAKCA